MVTSGIWRPVTIRFYDAASISDYHVKQLALTDQLANLSNELEINNILSRPLQAEVRINTSFERSAEKASARQSPYSPESIMFPYLPKWHPRTLDAEWMGKARPV